MDKWAKLRQSIKNTSMKDWIDYQIWHFKTFEFPMFVLSLKRTLGMM